MNIKYDYGTNVKDFTIDVNENEALHKCYARKLEMDNEKKKDLYDLMKDGLIPEKYHSFYKKVLD